MVIDRRRTYEIAQALLRARNKKSGSNILEDVAQTSTPPADESYGKPAFGGARFSLASQSGVPAGDKAASQSHELVPIPRPHPFRDPARFSLTTDATQLGFGGTGTYQSPEDAKNGFSDPKVYVDALRRRSWAHDETAKTNSPGHHAGILPLADGEPHMVKEAPHQEKKLPEIRYVTAGEIWSEFLGGIGKGIVQEIADEATSGGVARLAARGGVRSPDLFGPPISSWDDKGRQIAPGIMAVFAPGALRGPKAKTWRGKIIGKVEPPKHLKPGTVPFGNYMHEKIAEFLKASYPKTKFRINVKRGQQGVDMEYQSDLEPGFKYLDIKTNKSHSQKQLNRQIQNWGYDESTVRAISYDEQGNIYDGFGD